MKVMIVGSYIHPQYEPAMANAFKEINEEVYEFRWKEFFYSGSNPILKFSARFQNRFLFGPTINKLNRCLVKSCNEFKPDIVFLYRGTHILTKTIRRMQQMGGVVFTYNDDDPFSGIPSEFYWRHFIRGLYIADHNFVHRAKNFKDMADRGIKQSNSFFRSSYIDSKNFHIPCEKKIDVLFIGHYEPDGRDECILHLIKNGINVKVFGDNEWSTSKYYDELKEHLEIRALPLKEYNETINSAKIALVFLSKINSDTYTTRTFEIPATKTFMLSEYTEDLTTLYKEGEEAEYFRDKNELLEKVKLYLKDDEKRNRIAEKGYERLMADGHETKDRARQVLKEYYRLKGEKH